MAKDIGLNQNFDVFIDDRNDIALTEGRREVEQSIALQLTIFFHREIGSIDKDNAMDRLRLKARRLAEENERVDSLESAVVERHVDDPNRFKVRLLYDEAEEFSFEVP